VAIVVTKVTVIVLFAVMTIDFVTIEKALIAVLAQRMSFERVIVFVPDAFVNGQVFSIVRFSLVRKEFQMCDAQFTVELAMLNAHVSLELVECGEKIRANRASIGQDSLIFDLNRLVLEVNARLLGHQCAFLYARLQTTHVYLALHTIDLLAFLTTHGAIDFLAQNSHFDRAFQAHKMRTSVVSECAQIVQATNACYATACAATRREEFVAPI